MCLEKILDEIMTGGMLHDGLYQNGEHRSKSMADHFRKSIDQLTADIHNLVGEIGPITKQLATLTGIPTSTEEQGEEEIKKTWVWSLKLAGVKKKDIKIERAVDEYNDVYLQIKAKKKEMVVVDKVLKIKTDEKNDNDKKITATFKEAPAGDEVLKITVEEKEKESETIEIS